MRKTKTSQKLKTLNDISAAEAANLFNSILSDANPWEVDPLNPRKFPDNMAARDFLEGLEDYRNLSTSLVPDAFDEGDEVGDVLDGERAAVTPSAVPEVPAKALKRLSPKEKVVFNHVMKGLANKQIASEIKRSEATVKAQVSSIYRKYGVTGRGELLALAVNSSVRKEEE